MGNSENDKQKPDPELIKRIFQYINNVAHPEEIDNRIWQDPATVKPGKGAASERAIHPSLAKVIIGARERLPEKMFTAWDDFVSGTGMDPESLHNILYSFADIPIKGLDDLESRIGTPDYMQALPAGFADVGNFEVKDFECVYDSTTKTFSQITMTIITATPWQAVPGKLTLENNALYMTIDFPQDDTRRKISGQMKAGIISPSAVIPVTIEI